MHLAQGGGEWVGARGGGWASGLLDCMRSPPPESVAKSRLSLSLSLFIYYPTVFAYLGLAKPWPEQIYLYEASHVADLGNLFLLRSLHTYAYYYGWARGMSLKLAGVCRHPGRGESWLLALLGSNGRRWSFILGARVVACSCYL